nr:uncharacterized protein LOC113701629 isoform X1 [Coffea arabica]
MGGRSSKSSHGKKYTNPYASTYKEIPKQYDSQSNVYAQTQKQQPSKPVTAPQSVLEKVEKKQYSQEEEVVSPRLGSGYGSSDDEFYDGIPRFRRSSLQKSRSRRARVSEKAAEVFDTLGSSMANLNPGSAFLTGASAKNNELSILAFEVANTIVKGSNIMQGLSRRSIKLLKEVILPSEGVQNLVSANMDELLKIVATDKREELKIFAGEVVRFGNRCRDSQWHNLDRYFAKHSRDPQKQMREEAESIMQQLMILVQNTAELYQELHALDRLEQDYQHKRLEACISSANPRGNSPAIKNQKKLVKNLKRKTLWSRSLEEVMEKLVDIVLFLNREITNVFGNTDEDIPDVKDMGSQQRLGPSGLALHYANIILMIDSIVARSSPMPPNAREILYQSLPPSIKTPLRSKLHSFHVKKQLAVSEIKAEMEKTLQWLVPVATNTAKAHHGFGWVGEWANTGSELNRQSVAPNDIVQIETLHHADRQKTEAYIFELLLWLNYLVSQSKISVSGGNSTLSTKSQCNPTLEQSDQQSIQKDALSTLPKSSVEVSEDGAAREQQQTDEGTE